MNACERDAAGAAGELNRLTGGVFSRGAVNGAVYTALACSAENFLIRFRGLEHYVGANGAGQRAAVRQGFDGPHSPCAGGAQCGNRQKPDGPAPMTATVSPRRIEVRRREWTAMARGSERAASANESVAGMGRKLETGRLTSSRKKPGWFGLLRKRMLAHTL